MFVCFKIWCFQEYYFLLEEKSRAPRGMNGHLPEELGEQQHWLARRSAVERRGPRHYRPRVLRRAPVREVTQVEEVRAKMALELRGVPGGTPG